MKTFIRLAFLIPFLASVASCKLVFLATNSGYIISNTAYVPAGSICELDITQSALPFNETYRAVAKPGFKFVKWQGGTGSAANIMLCPDSTSPICEVNIPDDAIGAATLASFASGSLYPIFQIDNDGVPLDTDSDGVSDADDFCPDTPPTITVNPAGCETVDAPKATILDVQSLTPFEIEWDSPAALELSGVTPSPGTLIGFVPAGVSCSFVGRYVAKTQLYGDATGPEVLLLSYPPETFPPLNNYDVCLSKDNGANFAKQVFVLLSVTLRNDLMCP